MEHKYSIKDISIGNHVMFSRNGVNDFRMYWTVTGFFKEMIRIKIDEMGYNDEIFICAADIENLQHVNDTRYNIK